MNISPERVTAAFLHRYPLVEIFSFLTLSDLMNVSLVCKDWNRSANDELIWKPICSAEIPQFPRPLLRHSWKQHFTANFHGTRIKKIHYNKGNLYSAWNKTIAVWKANQQTDRAAGHHTVTDHAGAITCFCVRYSGIVTVMLTGSADSTVKIWERLSGKLSFTMTQTLKEPDAPITAIASYEQHIVSGDALGNLYLWSAVNGQYSSFKFINKITAHFGRVVAVGFDKKGSNQIFTASSDRSLKFWKITSAGFLLQKSLQTQKTETTACNASNNLSTIFTGHADGSLAMWKRSGSTAYKKVNEVQAHQGQITEIHMNPAAGFSDYIFTSGTDKSVKTWEWSIQKEGLVCIQILQSQSKDTITGIASGSETKLKQMNRKIYLASKSNLSILSGFTKETNPDTLHYYSSIKHVAF